MKTKIFNWLFKEQLASLKSTQGRLEGQVSKLQRQIDLFNMDVSVDFHERANSWACISIQGKSDYVKFIDLGDSDLRQISQFLRQFERNSNIKIDASPQARGFFKANTQRF